MSDRMQIAEEAVTSGKSADRLGGVLVTVQTPFLDNLAIDTEVLRAETDFLTHCSVNGLVWPVAASEVMSLSRQERLTGAEQISDELRGRLPLIVGITAHNQFEAADYARHASAIGASAVLTLPAADYQPTDPMMFAEYLRAIGKASDLPIVVQTSYPGHSSALSPHMLVHLAETLPALQYVKEEQVGVGPLPWRISCYLQIANRRVDPFGGAGARNLLNEMDRGSCGTMPGAGFADVQAQIWSLYRSGERGAARDLFSKMLMMAVLEQSVGYVIQKEILRRRGVFRNTLMRHTRRPLMDRGDMNELDAIFEVLGPYLIAQPR